MWFYYNYLMTSVDLSLFKLINNLAGQSLLLDQTGIFFAVYLIFFLPLIIILAYFLYRAKDKKRKILLIIINSFLAFLIMEILKHLIWMSFPRPRPFLVLEVNQLIYVSRFSSFPSGHASLAFVLAFGAYLFNQKIGWLLIVLASLISLARVFVGVHYPLDIFGGAFLALLSSLAVKKILTDKFATKL